MAEQETKAKVSKDMTIGDVIQKYPVSAEVMLSYGLGCVGCHVNALETIEQGCMGHGMSEDIIDKIINDINKMIEE